MMKNTWLQLTQIKSESTYNLICLPFAGGYAEYYLPWRERLHTKIQLCPVQLPGRSYRWQEPIINDMNNLFATMLPGLLPLLQEKPYILFGHSMGGYIAYEFCKLLQAKEIPLPALLMVSSLPAPQHWSERKRLSELSESEFEKFFFDLGGFRPELLQHTNFIKMQMNLLRNDILLCESTSSDDLASFPLPLIALGANDDEYVPIVCMNEWRQITAKEYAFHQFSGKHFYLNEHLAQVTGLINKWVLDNDYL